MKLETIYEKIRLATSEAEVQMLEEMLERIIAAAERESEYWERFASRVRRNCEGMLRARRMGLRYVEDEAEDTAKEFASLQALKSR